MPQVNDAAVLNRAKTLCEKDGIAWDRDFTPLRRGTKIKLTPTLNETDRREYLARARKQLICASGDA
jgi:hypothetical protein